MAREMLPNGTLFSTPLRGIKSRNEMVKKEGLVKTEN